MCCGLGRQRRMVSCIAFYVWIDGPTNAAGEKDFGPLVCCGIHWSDRFLRGLCSRLATCGLRLLANKFLPLTCSANQPINHSVICSVLSLCVYSFILSLFRSFMFSSPDAFIQFFWFLHVFIPPFTLIPWFFPTFILSSFLPSLRSFLPPFFTFIVSFIP